MRQYNAVLQSNENLKAQQNANRELANKERAQMEIDKQKDQKDAKIQEKMAHDLQKCIQNTEQELQNLVSKMSSFFVVSNQMTIQNLWLIWKENESNSESGDEYAPSSQKSLIGKNVSNIRSKTPSNVETHEKEVVFDEEKIPVWLNYLNAFLMM